MATSVRLIRRYVWLIETIRRAGNITLEEINRKWLEERSLRLEDEGEIPERTFHRHRQAIADLFGIDICCNRFNGNTYYIEDDEALNQPSFSSWLFNGLAIDNQLMDNREISSRIIFEDSPGGTEYLAPIIEAMTKNRMVHVRYRRFGKSDASEREVEPCGLKQSGRRWYLVAKIPGADFITVYSLDRIDALIITDHTFEPDKSFDVRAYFADVVGANVDDYFGCQTVALRVYGSQRAYLETLPLHKSQRLIAYTEEYSDYELTLRPEYEFQHAVLALGPDAEILSPSWLRDDIKFLADETAKRYE